MGQERREEENPDYVTSKLCEAYREVLLGQIKGLKDDLKDMKEDVKRIDGRLWWIARKRRRPRADSHTDRNILIFKFAPN